MLIERRRDMRRHIFSGFFFTYLIFLPIAIFFGGCSGGDGSGGEEVRVSPGFSSGTGTVSVFLTDGPTDEYEEINVWITEVSLIPLEGDDDRAPVVIFQSQSVEGYKVNLLDYRDEYFLLTINSDVPAGLYGKVRLRVSKIESVGGACDDKWIKLPSEKIDLTPQQPIEVNPGWTLSLSLDIDVDKSIGLHAAGQSGKCIFRPVVFVDIEAGVPLQNCPKIFTGTIVDLVDENEDGTINGFTLDLGERGELEVFLVDKVVIFDDEGLPTQSPNDLIIGQKVTVRGKLDTQGRLQASTVVIMELTNVLIVEGTVQGSLEGDLFPFLAGLGEPISGQVDVKVFDETLILSGCDEGVDKDAIQQGRVAKIYGKLILGDTAVFRAFAVILESLEVSGQLISVEPTEGGNTLAIRVGEDPLVNVFLPEATAVYLEGDGEVSLDLLSKLLECDEPKRQVRIVLDPDKPVLLTAIEVRLQTDRFEGEVDAFDSSRIVIVDGKRIYVQPGATILDLSGDEDVLIPLSDVKRGEETRYFGLEACPADVTDFYAFVVLVT
jgi:hypothetical protein